MSDREERLEEALRTTLITHADEAPPPSGGAAPVAVRRAARRRRTAVVVVAAASAGVIAAAVAVGHLGQSSGAGPSTPPVAHRSASSSVEDATPLPDGWRWESYGGVEVGVPGYFGYDNGTQRLTQWCIGHANAENPQPAIGRPGGSTLVACVPGPRYDGPGDPSTLIANAGVIVAFESNYDGLPPGATNEGDRTTVVVGDISVAIQAEAALRDRIAATVHRVDGLDAYGCPSESPVSNDPGQRPDQRRDLGSLTDVTSISVCKYSIAQPGYDQPGLLSSLVLEGQAATDEIAALEAAPLGGGPDDPSSCMVSYSYGDDMIVLRVESAAGMSEVYVRYSGCDHNGIDDGADVRALTADAVQPLIAGPNAVWGFSGGPGKAHIMGY